MKRCILILFVWVSLLTPAYLLGRTQSTTPYTDDAYYWPSLDTVVYSEPSYDRNVREFIFLEDTTQYPDTVKMRVVTQ